jgi:hypothetical protein
MSPSLTSHYQMVVLRRCACGDASRPGIPPPSPGDLLPGELACRSGDKLRRSGEALGRRGVLMSGQTRKDKGCRVRVPGLVSGVRVLGIGF